MSTQIQIKEDGAWKATVNLDSEGRVTKKYGDASDIEKIIIVHKPTAEDIEDAQRMVDEWENEPSGDIPPGLDEAKDLLYGNN